MPVVRECMGGGAGVMKAKVRKILMSSDVEQTCHGVGEHPEKGH